MPTSKIDPPLVLRQIVEFCILTLALNAHGTAASMDKLNVAYLSEDTIWVVRLPSEGVSANALETWPLPKGVQRESYAGLSCGMGNQVLMHQSKLLADSSGPVVRSQLIIADLEKRSIAGIFDKKQLNLVFPKQSPRGDWIAALQIGSEKPETLVLVPLAGSSLRSMRYRGMGSPQAWSKDGNAVYLTGLSANGRDWVKLRVDIGTGSFTELGPGGRPVPSPAGQQLAFLSNDQESLVVENDLGKPIRSFRGFFKDVVQWLDAHRILFITGKMYQDALGIADLDTGEVRVFELPSQGEISGACVLAESKQKNDLTRVAP